MLALSPHMFMFLSTLFMGTMISISSNNWVMMWMGLELNLLSFLPMMSNNPHRDKSQEIMKYFITQACASMIILVMTSASLIPTQTILSPPVTNFCTIIALFMKLGTAPCHWWFPAVIGSLDWPMVMLLLTWQKIAPLFIVVSLAKQADQLNMTILIGMSSLIGGIGGFMQDNLKPMLAYSSINHMAWMVGASLISNTISFLYFWVYFVTVWMLILFMMVNNIASSYKAMRSWKLHNPYKALCLFGLLLSMAGMPPLLGFLPKAIVFSFLVGGGFFYLIYFLFLGSVLNYSYYLNLILHLVASPQGLNKQGWWLNTVSVLFFVLGTSPILLVAVTPLF